MRPAFNQLLNYDRNSGIFTWKINAGRHGRYKAGTVAGSINTTGYCVIGVGKKQYEAHAIAWFMVTGEWPKRFIDHRDTDRTNNRFDNLRQATRSQNASNSKLRSDNKVKIKGVYAQGGKYRAQIRKNGKLHHLGMYLTIEDAAEAYRTAATELHGEFARSRNNG